MCLIATKLVMAQAIKIVVAGIVIPDSTHVVWAEWLQLFAAPQRGGASRPSWWGGGPRLLTPPSPRGDPSTPTNAKDNGGAVVPSNGDAI